MPSKCTIVLDGKCFPRHMDNLRAVFGDHGLPSLEGTDSLTVNYSLNLQMDGKMLEKLRSLMELAEDEDVQFSMDGETDIQTYSECVRLIEDLKAISEERKHKELWREKQEH